MRRSFPVALFSLALAVPAPALAVPGEVMSLKWCPGTKNCLQWTAVPGATQYLLYRGEEASLKCVVNPALDSCSDGVFTTNTTGGAIPETPAAGRFYWFIVTAANGTGEGSPGMWYFTPPPTMGPRQVNITGACSPSCAQAGAVCASGGNCCSTLCMAGRCIGSCCQPNLAACTMASDCCSGICHNGTCQASCAAAQDCPGTDTECKARLCTAGMCGFFNAPSGTPTSSQTAGDCHKNVCDGTGNVTSVIDNTDVPVDGIQCTDDVCTNGTPSNPLSVARKPCNQNGGVMCNGTGTCVQCVGASDCPGTDTECRTRTCTAGACGFSFAPSGTPTSSQTAGDCHKNVCDGAGNVTSAIDNTDVPVDGIQCTDDVCTNGTPSNPPSAMGTPCSGGQCDGTGSCFACGGSNQFCCPAPPFCNPGKICLSGRCRP